jgi:hypothetical protein
MVLLERLLGNLDARGDEQRARSEKERELSLNYLVYYLFLTSY